jgi:hypothetical protein
MRARHRCPRCKNTFGKREQLEYHLQHTCSDEARAKRRRDAEELSVRLAAHERVLAEMDRDGERRREYGGFRRTIVSYFTLDLGDFFMLFGQGPRVGPEAQIDPPDLLNARRNEDGTFST